MKTVTIYTDGSCINNPGPGGWAAILEYKGHIKEIFGYNIKATNTQMALEAVIQGIEHVTESCEIIIHTDSQYVIDGATKYIPKWELNGWRLSNKKPVRNKSYFQKISSFLDVHSIKWIKVPAHSGVELNERADFLARQAAIQQITNESIE